MPPTARNARRRSRISTPAGNTKRWSSTNGWPCNRPAAAPDTLATVKALSAHPAFDIGNPNKVYALIRAFGANLPRFNAADGSGYTFIADRVLDLHDRNPQVASRLARCFDRWQKFDAGRQAHARAALERIHNHDGLSRDVSEIVARALGDAGSGGLQ